MRKLPLIGAAAMLATATAAIGQTGQLGEQPDPAFLDRGATLFFDRCIQCHDGGDDRAPGPEALGMVSHEAVIASMTVGPMTPMAAGWTEADMRAVAAYIATFRADAAD